jgi:hypothetical protein
MLYRECSRAEKNMDRKLRGKSGEAEETKAAMSFVVLRYSCISSLRRSKNDSCMPPGPPPIAIDREGLALSCVGDELVQLRPL